MKENRISFIINKLLYATLVTFLFFGCQKSPTEVEEEVVEYEGIAPVSQAPGDSVESILITSCNDFNTYIYYSPSDHDIYIPEEPSDVNFALDADVYPSGGGSVSGSVLVTFDQTFQLSTVFSNGFTESFTRSVSVGFHSIDVEINACGIRKSYQKVYHVQELPSATLPSLTSPSNNQLTDNQVIFRWNSDAMQATHELVVDDNSNFSSPEFSQSGISSTSKSVTLQRNKKYYWKVRSSNAAGTSSWSSVRSIRVRPEKPLVSASINGYSPSLSWNTINGATHYKIVRTSWDTNLPRNTEFTTSNTSYSDHSLPYPVEQIFGRDPNMIRYQVAAVNSYGWESLLSSDFYFVEEQQGGGRY